MPQIRRRADKLLESLTRALARNELDAWTRTYACDFDPLPEAWEKCRDVLAMWSLLTQVDHPAVWDAKRKVYRWSPLPGRSTHQRWRAAVPSITLADMRALQPAAYAHHQDTKARIAATAHLSLDAQLQQAIDDYHRYHHEA